MAVILCLNNLVTKKFRYYIVPQDPAEISRLAESLGLNNVHTEQYDFAEYAVGVLSGPKMDVWVDEMEPDDDPWDFAKELRYKHYGAK